MEKPWKFGLDTSEERRKPFEIPMKKTLKAQALESEVRKVQPAPGRLELIARLRHRRAFSRRFRDFFSQFSSLFDCFRLIFRRFEAVRVCVSTSKGLESLAKSSGHRCRHPKRWLDLSETLRI